MNFGNFYIPLKFTLFINADDSPIIGVYCCIYEKIKYQNQISDTINYRTFFNAFSFLKFKDFTAIYFNLKYPQISGRLW